MWIIILFFFNPEAEETITFNKITFATYAQCVSVGEQLFKQVETVKSYSCKPVR